MDAVLASWKGGQITLADIQSVVDMKTEPERVELAAPGGREQLLEDLVRFDLLVAEAAKRGYANDRTVIDGAKNAAIEALWARDFTVTPEAVTSEQLEAYWKENGAQFQRPHVRRAAHVQLATEAEAKALLRELRGADRTRFAQVAVARSRDEKTNHQGGELGYFDSDGAPRPAPTGPHVAPELAKAAFALRKLGDIHPRPIRHAEGFSVLMLTGEMEPRERSLSGMEGELREVIAQELTEKLRDSLLAQLREQQKPEVHADLVDAIVLPPARDLDIPQGYPAAPRDPRQPPQMKAPDRY